MVAHHDHLLLVKLFWRQVMAAHPPVLVSDKTRNTLQFPLWLQTWSVPLSQYTQSFILIHSLLHTHALAQHSLPHIRCAYCIYIVFNGYFCFKIIVWCFSLTMKRTMFCVSFFSLSMDNLWLWTRICLCWELDLTWRNFCTDFKVENWTEVLNCFFFFCSCFFFSHGHLGINLPLVKSFFVNLYCNRWSLFFAILG